MGKNVLKLEISTSTILKVVGILIFAYFLYLIRDVLVILLVSFILAAALEPAVDKLQKKLKFPRWAGAISIYILFLAVVYAFIMMIAPIVSEQVSHLIANKDNYANDVKSMISSWPREYQDQVNGFVQRIPEEIKSWQIGGITHKVSGIFSSVGSFVAIVVISIYVLSLKNGMQQTVSAFVPEKNRVVFIKMFSDITRKVSFWFRGQLILSFSIGLVAFIGLWIMHVPYALILAIFAGFAELIPMLGATIGAIPAIIVAFFISPIMALVVAIYFIFVQQLENHILVPQVMRRAVGLNPVIIISAMLIGAKLLGIMGVILAVPIASSIAVVIKEWPKKEVTSGN